jgi:hypothetical protein
VVSLPVSVSALQVLVVVSLLVWGSALQVLAVVSLPVSVSALQALVLDLCLLVAVLSLQALGDLAALVVFYWVVLR